MLFRNKESYRFPCQLLLSSNSAWEKSKTISVLLIAAGPLHVRLGRRYCTFGQSNERLWLSWIVESEMFANVSRIHDKPQAIDELERIQETEYWRQEQRDAHWVQLETLTCVALRRWKPSRRLTVASSFATEDKLAKVDPIKTAQHRMRRVRQTKDILGGYQPVQL